MRLNLTTFQVVDVEVQRSNERLWLSSLGDVIGSSDVFFAVCSSGPRAIRRQDSANPLFLASWALALLCMGDVVRPRKEYPCRPCHQRRPSSMTRGRDLARDVVYSKAPLEGMRGKTDLAVSGKHCILLAAYRDLTQVERHIIETFDGRASLEGCELATHLGMHAWQRRMYVGVHTRY
jgi:hypothetical protein